MLLNTVRKLTSVSFLTIISWFTTNSLVLALNFSLNNIQATSSAVRLAGNMSINPKSGIGAVSPVEKTAFYSRKKLLSFHT